VILLDGVRTSDPATGLSDLSRLDIDMRDIDTLEVIRGGVSAQYGADAIGGVIAITTKKEAKPRVLCGFSFHRISACIICFRIGS
jgi:outer membrane cobalamin receptor